MPCTVQYILQQKIMHCTKYSWAAEDHALFKNNLEQQCMYLSKYISQSSRRQFTVKNILEQQKILYFSVYPRVAESYAP
jgi:hypothetical protein